MEMLFAAIALFGAVWAVTMAVRAEPRAATFEDVPNPLPQPGARDVHTVSHGTLGRAPVPRWT
ncbi:MAG: hypothetical protein JWM98_1960 [Thermoleophilia bacterium]|nr:hypothetical protein [Thermoleophilia bacterium]